MPGQGTAPGGLELDGMRSSPQHGWGPHHPEEHPGASVRLCPTSAERRGDGQPRTAPSCSAAFSSGGSTDPALLQQRPGAGRGYLGLQRQPSPGQGWDKQRLKSEPTAPQPPPARPGIVVQGDWGCFCHHTQTLVSLEGGLGWPSGQQRSRQGARQVQQRPAGQQCWFGRVCRCAGGSGNPQFLCHSAVLRQRKCEGG